jgi:ACS family tartrate transporter-like MFS transporter
MAADGRVIHRKIHARIVLLIMCMIILSSIDRGNISFAALQMNKELGLSDKAYGFGASIFFFGYILFQIPTMMLLKRIGARRWIFLTVTVWGVVATLMAFIQNATHLYILRFLLGIAEAGFAPGCMYFITRWLPSAYRGRGVAGTMLAIPISVVIGAPIAGSLLSLTAMGLPGWRWLFLLEGLPTVAFGLFAYFWFVDRPRDAKWLTEEEKAWIETEIAKDDADAAGRSGDRTGWLEILKNPLIWCCCGVWFALVTGGNGIMFWLPLAIKSMSGLNDFQTALLAALPWVALGFGTWLNARHSDRTQERFWHVGLAALLGAAGLIAASLSGATAIALVFLIIGGLGLGGGQGTFWTIPFRMLSGGQGANGVAIINLVGNIGSLLIPSVIGLLRHATGQFASSIYLMAGLLVVGALLIVPIALADRKRAPAA